MTFKKTSVPACIVLLVLCQAAAVAATLKSSDNGFLLNIPGKWQAAEVTGPNNVLRVKKGRSEIKILYLSGFSAEKALRAKLQATREKLKRGGVAVPNKIFSATNEDGAEFIFLRFSSKGRRYRSGYFNLSGRSYGFLLTDLSSAEFEAMSGSLVPLLSKAGSSPADQREPAGRIPAPAAASLPPAEKGGGAPAANPGAANMLPPPVSTDTLGAPPVGASFAAGGAQPEPGALPPVPKRSVGSSLLLFLIVIALSAAALGYRALAGRAQEVPEVKPVTGSPFPFRVERRYLSFPIVFDVKDAAGQQYSAVSYRVPALLLGTGVVLYFLITVLIQGMLFAGEDPRLLPTAEVMLIVNLLHLAGIMVLVGFVLGLFFRKKLKIYDSSGNLILDVCQKRLSFASLYFLIRDPAGNGLGKMKRVGFVFIRRRWQLLDAGDKVLLDIREDSVAKAIARKLLGHLWGLLRTNYIISRENSETGEIKRDWSIWNRYTLKLAPVPQGPAPDPRLVMATALFIDIVDPDRWHPWHG